MNYCLKTILQKKTGTESCYKSYNRKPCHDWYSVTGIEKLESLRKNTICISSGRSKIPAL